MLIYYKLEQWSLQHLLLEQTSLQKVWIIIENKTQVWEKTTSESTQETNPIQCPFTSITFIIF